MWPACEHLQARSPLAKWRMLATQTALETSDLDVAAGRWNFVEPVTRLWKLPASWPEK